MDVGRERKRVKISRWMAGGTEQKGAAVFQGGDDCRRSCLGGRVGQGSGVLFQTLSLKCKLVTQVEILNRQ